MKRQNGFSYFTVRAMVVVMAAGLVMGACDEELGPEDGLGTVAFQPIFSSAAAVRFPFASVRIRLTRSDSATTAKDTVIAIAADQDTVSLELRVVLLASSEDFFLDLELRDSSGTTLFASLTTVVTATPNGAAASPTPVDLRYVGVGANATAVQITSGPVFIGLGDTAMLQAAALDSVGEPIQGTPILWSTTDTARARFPSILGGVLVAGDEPGDFLVIAELFTGQADTAQAALIAGTGNLSVAIGALENALFLAIPAVDDSLGTRDQVVDWTAADQFSFEPARVLFEQAFQIDPGNDTAAFGLAITTILALKEDPTVRMRAQQWDDWQALIPFDAIDSLFMGSGPFPPTLAEMQTVLRDVVLPALQTSLAAVETMDDPNFLFIVTDRMQGRSAPSTDPDEVPREIDYTDVLFLKAALNAMVAFADGALAYQVTPSPYGASGVDAALMPGSAFLTLAAGGGTYLADAQVRLQNAVAATLAAFDAIELETDDQSNDVVIWNPQDTCCPKGLAELTMQDLLDARPVLAEVAASLQGPGVWNEDFNDDGVDQMVTIDATQPLLSPVTDLKTLLPSYFTLNGEFFWTALAVDEFLFPDPTFGGLFPGIATSDSLIRTFDLGDLWDDANPDVEEWVDINTHPAAAANLALTERGRFHGIAPDFSADSAGPSLPFDTLTFQFYHSIASNSLTAEQWASNNDGNIYTRPNDVATGWTLQTNVCCGPHDMVESPVATGVMFLYNGFDVYEVSSDLSTVTLRAQNFAGGNQGFAVNLQNNELVTLDFVGFVQAWSVLDTAALGVFSQVFTLSIPSTDGGFVEWTDLTLGPNGSLWAITENGGLVELLADYSAAFERPPVPTLDDVVAISQDVSNTVLIALTEDGKLFTRPADATTPWTLARTLTRYVLTPLP